MSDPLLASDDDRERALGLLRSASVDGRLTIEDLAERAELIHDARTRDDVAAATTGLGPVLPAPEAEERHRAVLSTTVREGRWARAPRNGFAAIMGTMRLDLRDAVLPGPEVEILVPDGVHVHVTGDGMMSTHKLTLPTGAPAGAPVIRIVARGALGTLRVSCKPRLVDQLRETALRIWERRTP